MSFKSALRDIFEVVALYVVLGAVFTFSSLVVSSEEVRIGAFRPLAAIPAHEVELLSMSLLISALALLFCRRFDFSLLLLPPVFVTLLDVDHIPSAFGLAQPIRPAHSIFFVAILTLCIYFILKKPSSIALLSVASFLGHMAVDNGVFAILSPLSFQYFSLAYYKSYLFAGSAFLAIISGLVHRWDPRSMIRLQKAKAQESSSIQ